MIVVVKLQLNINVRNGAPRGQLLDMNLEKGKYPSRKPLDLLLILYKSPQICFQQKTTQQPKLTTFAQ